MALNPSNSSNLEQLALKGLRDLTDESDASVHSGLSTDHWHSRTACRDPKKSEQQ